MEQLSEMGYKYEFIIYYLVKKVFEDRKIIIRLS